MRYRRLFESAKDGILILDFNTGRIIDANPYIIEIINSTLPNVIGKELWEIGLFSNKELSELAFTKLKTNGYVRFEDMPVQGPNGKITEVEFISNVYLANNIKVIQCNIRNITERKEFERKQELSNKILSILSNPCDWKRSINDILDEIKNYVKVDAIGIRLKKNDEYPFYATKGYPEYFIQIENSISKKNDKGKIIRIIKENRFLNV